MALLEDYLEKMKNEKSNLISEFKEYLELHKNSTNRKQLLIEKANVLSSFFTNDFMFQKGDLTGAENIVVLKEYEVLQKELEKDMADLIL